MITSRQNLGLTLGFIGVCMFAGTLPATRIAVQGFDPWFLTAARAAIAGFASVLLLLMTRRRIPPRSLWLEIAVAAICTVIGFPLFAALAMRTVPAAHGGVVLGILPLATAVAAAVLAHERPSRGFWLLTLCGAGIVLLFVMRSNENTAFAAGDLFLLGMVVSGALGYTWSGRLTAHMPGWEVISWQVAIFLPAAALATILLWPKALGGVPASAWAGLAYVGLISQYMAFFVFNAAMAMAGIARVGQLTLLQPFAVVILAWPINGEPIRLETVVFATAVVVTVLLAQRTQVARRLVPEAHG